MYERIVVGTDGSDRAATAVEHAAKLASVTGAALHLAQGSGSPIAVAPLYGEVAAIDPRPIVEACAAELETLAGRLRARGLDVTVHVVPTAGAEALRSVAQDVDADLIVCGNRGLTGARRVLGSVPKSIVGKAECAVLIVDTG